MAYECLNASLQHFTFPALNVSVPPVTFSMWINTASIVAKDTALFCWRGTTNTAVLLTYVAPNWQVRYFVNNGLQWQTATGLNVATGLWQHVCVAIETSQARLYLDGTLFTNSTTHTSASINTTGYLARDPLVSPTHTSYNGSIAEAAMWTTALPHAECLALAKRMSPLLMKNRLHDLIFCKDLVRDADRGIGATVTAVNSPTIVPHPPIIWPQSRLRARMPPPRFVAPYRHLTGAVDADRAVRGGAAIRGAASGILLPIGEVSS